MAFLFRIPKSQSLLQNSIQLRFISYSSSLTTNHSKSRNILSLLKSEINPDRILQICESASLKPNRHVDRIVFSVAVVTLAKEKHFAAVTHLLDGFIHDQPNPKSESFAARAIVLYGRANMLDRSLKTFHDLEIHDITRTVKSLNALLLACLMAKDHEEAKRVYFDMPKRYNIEPDVETYNRMIRVYCECGLTSLAYSIVEDMKRARIIKPKASTFGLMISGFCLEEKYDDVKRVLRMMRELGVHVGVATYNVLIQCMCKRKRSREAKALLDWVVTTRIRPNFATYSYLIHGFCGEENVDEALCMFKAMLRSGYKPDSECYFVMIHGLCKGGDFETALILCKQSMEKNWVPSFSVMKWLVNGLVSLSKVEEAKKVIAQVKEKFTRNVYLWEEVEVALPK
ncbi:unnamed protein product [Cochlearia groenlandica]